MSAPGERGQGELLAILRWDRGPRVSHVTGLYLIAGLCGLVDAACFLSLGQVFAEMMTGNLLLFCFYVGTGHPIFQHAVCLIALGAFALGAIGIFMLCAMLGAALTKTIAPWAPLLLALVLFSVALTGLTRQDPAAPAQ